MWKIVLAGLGLWFLIEGLVYAAAPDMMRRFGALLANMPEAAIRQAGLLSVGLGLVLLYAMLRFGGA